MWPAATLCKGHSGRAIGAARDRKRDDVIDLKKSAPAVKTGGVGGVAEWLKAHAWKACIRETVSRVRIPLPPPYYMPNQALKNYFPEHPRLLPTNWHPIGGAPDRRP